MKASFNNFYKPTPAKLKKLAWAIKAFTGSASLTLILEDYKWAGIACALVGASADFVIELFTEDGKDGN